MRTDAPRSVFDGAGTFRFERLPPLLYPRSQPTYPRHYAPIVTCPFSRSDALVALRLQQKAYALKHGTVLPDMVFPSRLGTLLDDANVRHIFKRVLRKAELRHVRFHDLRHTFASLLIQQGESSPT